MLNKVSIIWVLVGAVGVVGIVPLITVAITDSIVGGVVALIVVAGVVAIWPGRTIGQPIQNLAEVAKDIEDNLKDEKRTDFSDIEIEQPKIGQEITTLSNSLQQLLNAFQKRLTELNSIHAISQTITSSTLDYEKTVKSVLAAVQQVVDYDAAEVSVLRGKGLVVEAWFGKEGFKDTTGRKYRLGKGPTGTIAATKEPIFLSTVKPSEDLQRTIGYASVETEFISKTTKLVINSFLGIPLLIGDRLVGTLTLVHHEEGYFTDDDKRQLNKLADHASIAIDNALKVHEREEELKNQIRELKIEIDQSKRRAQVEEVTDSDFFRNLQSSAAKMRERHNRPDKPDETEEADVTGEDSTDDS